MFEDGQYMDVYCQLERGGRRETIVRARSYGAARSISHTSL